MAQHNPGKITASTCSAILTKANTPDDLPPGAVTFARQLALERLELAGTVRPDPDEPDLSSNPDIIRGNELELDAGAAYEERMFAAIHDAQIGATRSEWLACTPDGYVGTDGLVETKCPRRKKHFEYLLDPSELEKQYGDQARFQLYVTGRNWCDLVSYCPLFDAPRDVVIRRVHVSPKWVTLLETRLALLETEIEHILKSLPG